MAWYTLLGLRVSEQGNVSISDNFAIYLTASGAAAS